MISDDIDRWGDPESVQTSERWKYVGQGRGSYNEQSKLEYVGEGLFQEALKAHQANHAATPKTNMMHILQVFLSVFDWICVFNA